MNVTYLEEAVEKIINLTPSLINPLVSDEHIFFSIVKENNLTTRSKEYMNAAYFHYHAIKAIAELRNRNENLASWYLSKVDLNALEVSERMKADLGIVYLPLLSYNAYVKGNYMEALRNLRRSIELIDSKLSISANAIQFLKAKVEQITNIFRIHIADKNFEEAISVSAHVLQYLNYQKKNALFYHNINFPHEAENRKSDWLELVDFYTDTIMAKLLVLIQNKELDEYYLFRKLTEKLHDPNKEKGFGLLYDYYHGHSKLFVGNILKLPLPSITTMPFSIRYIIISKILKLYKEYCGAGIIQLWQSFLVKNDVSNFSSGLVAKDLLFQD